MKNKRHTLKEILNGKLTKKQARQQLKQESHTPTLIKWSNDSYSLWPDKGRLTEKQVKKELGTDSLDDVVMIAFS